MIAAAEHGPSSDESLHGGNVSGTKRKRRDTAGTLPDNSDKERHQCPHCERSFGRVEHMKRHAASHSDERPFRCSTCDKGFHRLDTMQRHELIHKESSEHAKPRGARACGECALAKVRCPGGQPCHRCETKSIDCRYPEIRSRAEDADSPNGAIQDDDDDDEDHDHDRDHSHPQLPTQQPPPQFDGASVRSQSLVVPFSPSMWNVESPNTQHWLPQTNAQVNMTPRTEFREPTLSARAMSFGSAPPRATGLTPVNSIDPYSNLRQAGFVTATAPDTASINGSGTRNWLETLLAPQSMDVRDASTPDTNSHSQRTVSASETYLDGDGARLPKIGIHRRFNLRPSLPIPLPNAPPIIDVPPVYGFPQRVWHTELELSNMDRRLINQVVYGEIRRNFELTCGPQASFSPVFQSSEYPTWDHMHSFIQIYLDEFQPLVPMLHLPTLDLQSSHWLLSLAMASMGCNFADMPEAEVCALSLNEHLRRAISILTETSEAVIDPVLFAQVKLLNNIAMIYSGDERLEAYGWRNHLDVVKYCKTHWLNEAEITASSSHMRTDVEVQWREWRDVEARRRTGYAIWLLDSMWSYGYGERSLLTLQDAAVPLPCQEVLWEAESALQWQHVKSYSVPMPSLCAASHSIYIENSVEPTMGEFSRILLIHALYSASWAVQTHLRNPMSHWTPRASRQDLSSIPAFRQSIWLPSEPTYFRWRNATCDSLDILHWRANAVTGAASGIEHPTLLHLHLARIILLTPFREICDLAFGLVRLNLNSTSNVPSTETSIARNREIVRRWAEYDQPKARLAMYHAGVLFWHIRLYSAKGFYEPSAVMLAALALWAFGTFTPKTPTTHAQGTGLSPSSPILPPGSSPQNNMGATGTHLQSVPGVAALTFPSPTADDEASFPTSINIDRPADDEIVQMYIRRGDRMQALIVGVGDIRSTPGPYRVLLEGAKLTSSLANWGSSRRVMRVLVDLARVVREQPGLVLGIGV